MTQGRGAARTQGHHTLYDQTVEVTENAEAISVFNPKNVRGSAGPMQQESMATMHENRKNLRVLRALGGEPVAVVAAELQQNDGEDTRADQRHLPEGAPLDVSAMKVRDQIRHRDVEEVPRGEGEHVRQYLGHPL
jgi:hypothetical protein